MNKENIGIYLLTCIDNNKQYVGQTCVGFKKRWDQHKKAAYNIKRMALYNLPLYRSIRKHGWNNFNKEIICYCSIEDIDEQEVLYIQKYDTLHPNGYNMTTGGNAKKQVCDATREKMIVSLVKRHKDKPMTDESKKMVSDSLKNYYKYVGESLETKERKSSSHQKTSIGLPRYVNRRIFPKKIVYCIGKHPKLKYKQFETLKECLRYLFMLNNEDAIIEILNKLKIIIDSINRTQILINELENQISTFENAIKSKI